MTQKINQAGIDLIKHFEGLHEKCGESNGEQLVKSYYCPADVLTIGYGTTGHQVRLNTVITESTAEQWLKEDLEYFEKAVSRLVRVKLNGNEFSALVSFAYNCGEFALGNSTALARLNQGDRKGCVEALQWWNKANRRVLPGLVRRRKAEGELFMSISKQQSETSKDEINLKVPYFSQLDNAFKPHSACLATSVSMVCAFFGEKPSNPGIQMEDEFYQWLQKKGMNRFVHDNMTKVFETCGYKNKFKTDASIDEIKAHLRKGFPVIYSGKLTHSGHIIVIRGFNEDKKCWYVNDPYGEWFSSGYRTDLTGENLEYSYGLLSRLSMTGLPNKYWAHFPSTNK